jgi:hypothetical protein
MTTHRIRLDRSTQPLGRIAKAAMALEVLLGVGALGGGLVLASGRWSTPVQRDG